MNKLVIPPSPNWYATDTLACAPDNTLIYGARNDLVVIFAHTPNEVADVRIISKAHSMKVASVSVNKNWGKPNKLAVTTAEDKIVKVWDINLVKGKLSHNGHFTHDRVIGAAFASDEKVVSASENGIIIIWNLTQNEQTVIKDLFGRTKVSLSCLSICPHANWLTAFGLKNGLVVIVDLRRGGRILYKLRGHDKEVTGFAWCPAPVNVFPKTPGNIVSAKKPIETVPEPSENGEGDPDEKSGGSKTPVQTVEQTDSEMGLYQHVMETKQMELKNEEAAQTTPIKNKDHPLLNVYESSEEFINLKKKVLGLDDVEEIVAEIPPQKRRKSKKSAKARMNAKFNKFVERYEEKERRAAEAAERRKEKMEKKETKPDEGGTDKEETAENKDGEKNGNEADNAASKKKNKRWRSRSKSGNKNKKGEEKSKAETKDENDDPSTLSETEKNVESNPDEDESVEKQSEAQNGNSSEDKEAGNEVQNKNRNETKEGPKLKVEKIENLCDTKKEETKSESDAGSKITNQKNDAIIKSEGNNASILLLESNKSVVLKVQTEKESDGKKDILSKVAKKEDEDVEDSASSLSLDLKKNGQEAEIKNIVPDEKKNDNDATKLEDGEQSNSKPADKAEKTDIEETASGVSDKEGDSKKQTKMESQKMRGGRRNKKNYATAKGEDGKPVSESEKKTADEKKKEDNAKREIPKVEPEYEEPRREFLLASTAKDCNIYIWRAGTDGRMQNFLTLPRSIHSGVKTINHHMGREWTTICWPAPTQILAANRRAHLIEFFLPKPVDINKQFRTIHKEHSNLLFNIVSPPRIFTEENWRDEYHTNAWSTGIDRVILNTSLDEDCRNLHRYPTSGGSITCFAHSIIDPNRLAIGNAEGHLKLWDLSLEHTSSIPMARIFQRISGKVSTMSWHPEKEAMVAFGTVEGRVGLLDVLCRAKVPDLFPQYFKTEVYRVEWGPIKADLENLGLYVVSEGKLAVFSLRNIKADPKEIKIPEDAFVYSFSWKPDYTHLLLSTKSGVFYVFSTDFKIVSTSYLNRRFCSINWHPEAGNSDAALSKYCNYFTAIAKGKQCVVYNLKDGSPELVCEVASKGGLINDVAWSLHEADKLVFVTDDGVAEVFNIETQTIISTYLYPHFESLTAVIWSPVEADLIITGAKDYVLTVWSVSENPPKTQEEVTKQRKAVLKEIAKETNMWIPKVDEQATMTSPKKEKKIKPTLLPRLYSHAEGKLVTDLQKLIRWKDGDKKLEGHIGDDESIDILDVFSTKDRFTKFIEVNQRSLMEKGKHQFADMLSFYKGDLLTSIRDAIETKRVTPWIISMAPMVSHALWCEACDAYIEQLSEAAETDTFELVSYLLARHKLKEAIKVLCDAYYLPEAFSLARLRFSEDDPAVDKVMVKWAQLACHQGNFERAAQCYVYLGRYSDAAQEMYRRSAFAPLEAAMLLAERSGKEELVRAVQYRYEAFREHIDKSGRTKTAKKADEEKKDEGSEKIEEDKVPEVYINRIVGRPKDQKVKMSKSQDEERNKAKLLDILAVEDADFVYSSDESEVCNGTLEKTKDTHDEIIKKLMVMIDKDIEKRQNLEMLSDEGLMVKSLEEEMRDAQKIDMVQIRQIKEIEKWLDDLATGKVIIKSLTPEIEIVSGEVVVEEEANKDNEESTKEVEEEDDRSPLAQLCSGPRRNFQKDDFGNSIEKVMPSEQLEETKKLLFAKIEELIGPAPQVKNETATTEDENTKEVSQKQEAGKSLDVQAIDEKTKNTEQSQDVTKSEVVQIPNVKNLMNKFEVKKDEEKKSEDLKKKAVSYQKVGEPLKNYEKVEVKSAKEGEVAKKQQDEKPSEKNAESVKKLPTEKDKIKKDEEKKTGDLKKKAVLSQKVGESLKNYEKVEVKSAKEGEVAKKQQDEEPSEKNAESVKKLPTEKDKIKKDEEKKTGDLKKVLSQKVGEPLKNNEKVELKSAKESEVAKKQQEDKSSEKNAETVKKLQTEKDNVKK